MWPFAGGKFSKNCSSFAKISAHLSPKDGQRRALILESRFEKFFSSIRTRALLCLANEGALVSAKFINFFANIFLKRTKAAD